MNIPRSPIQAVWAGGLKEEYCRQFIWSFRMDIPALELMPFLILNFIHD